jgi:hypothetical protein
MARIKSVAQIQKALTYAQARATYYANTTRPVKDTVDVDPKDVYVYTSQNLKVGTTAALYRVQASVAAVTKFGDLTGTGLLAKDTAGAGNKPRGFIPAQIHGTVGADTPTVGTSPVSGRRTVKYTAEATGDARASYTSPITTIALFEAAATALASEFKTDGYGRIWYTPEKFTISG